MKRALIAIFFTHVFLSFFTPMELGGFWWHLSTGQWIIEHWGIPVEDPFTSTAAGGRDVSFVLSAFWLCQVFYAYIHKLLGLYGIIALKAATFTLIFIIATRFGNGALPAYLASLPAVYVAAFYDESRPQTFSFLFFAVALYILEKGRAAFKDGTDIPRSIYVLPFLMVLWANVHPGFVIGIAIIGAYAAEAFFHALFRGRWKPTWLFIAMVSVSAAATALNPNGFEAVVRTAQMLETTPTIHEHLPLREFAEFTGGQGLYPAIISLIVLGAISFAAKRKLPDLLDLAVFAVLSFLALKTFRAGFFFTIFALATIGSNLSSVKTPVVLTGRIARLFAALSLAAVILFMLLPRTILKKPLLTEGVFPEKAATFIMEEKLPPNIYHPYEWGGYLMWRLYPEYKVFIDSRGTGSVSEHDQVLHARPGWEEILDKYDVNTVLFWPLLPYRSDVPPIIMEMQGSDRWSPVYWDSRSVIFVRSELARNTINKGAVWELLTSFLFIKIEKDPGNPDNHNSLGEIYAARGLNALAEREFRMALSLDPQNSRATTDLNRLHYKK